MVHQSGHGQVVEDHKAVGQLVDEGLNDKGEASVRDPKSLWVVIEERRDVVANKHGVDHEEKVEKYVHQDEGSKNPKPWGVQNCDGEWRKSK